MNAVKEIKKQRKALKSMRLLLHFSGCKGTTIVKNPNKTLKNILPINVKTCIKYIGQKLGSYFQMEDGANEKYENNLIHYAKCPDILYKRLYS